jgi:hypothetical protein
MKTPSIPPKQKADQLIRSSLIALGLSPYKQISIEAYIDAQQSANATIDAIFDFMKEDDDLHESAHFANSIWVDYYMKVRKEL